MKNLGFKVIKKWLCGVRGEVVTNIARVANSVIFIKEIADVE